MVTLIQVKSYLRIPHNEDDDYINLVIKSGYDYLYDAVDNFDQLMLNERFARKADMWVLTQYVPEMYEKREGMTMGGPILSYTARAALTQLQLTV